VGAAVRDATLVLLHPVGLDAACWQFLDLASPVAPEFPGHGTRPRPEASWTLDDAADEVAAAVAGPLDVVGVSMGGMVAQHLALRHPGRVRSLVLACTSARAHRAATLERADAIARGGIESVLDSTLVRWFTPSTLAEPHHAGVAYARQRLRTDDPVTFAQTWRVMAEHDVVERLGRIVVPVTVIAGAHDTASPVEQRRAVQRSLPNSRMEVLDGPHMLQLEVPQVFSDAIRRHLRWVVRGGTG